MTNKNPLRETEKGEQMYQTLKRAEENACEQLRRALKGDD